MDAGLSKIEILLLGLIFILGIGLLVFVVFPLLFEGFQGWNVE